MRSFHVAVDPIGTLLNRKKWPTETSQVVVLVDSLASGTRFTTVSSDGEDEDLGEEASESSTSAELESIMSWLKGANRSGPPFLLRSKMAYF